MGKERDSTGRYDTELNELMGKIERMLTNDDVSLEVVLFAIRGEIYDFVKEQCQKTFDSASHLFECSGKQTGNI